MMRYTRDKLMAEAGRLFGTASVNGVMKILDEYSLPEGQAGRERIQMAILLCSEGKIDRLRHFLEAARQDYRDVLYWTGLPAEDGS